MNVEEVCSESIANSLLNVGQSSCLTKEVPSEHIITDSLILLLSSLVTLQDHLQLDIRAAGNQVLVFMTGHLGLYAIKLIRTLSGFRISIV